MKYTWSWLYNIIITTIVSSIVAILMGRFILYMDKIPNNPDDLCSKFYWDFSDYLQSQNKLENPTG